MKNKTLTSFNSKEEFLSELLKIHERADELSRNSFVSVKFKDKSFSERIEAARQLDKEEVVLPTELGEVSEDINSLIRAATILDLLGMENTSRDIRKYLHVAGQYKIMENYMMSHIANDEAKNILSEKNSENASGPRNEYHDEAIKIMVDTWCEYPLASKNRMKTKVIEYFGKDRSGKDKVSDSSIKRWIKLNNLGPEKEVRPPIDFHLVIRP
ncbi:hypothetical protein [Serratia marcescens]|uniref:hypothetical protein n=1 Tax=Serratia marcescens TaxID=615 RepID=UPI00217AA678|nr:hypothetical protein [Serratia marcescens]CAI1712626.1 Uncharacterised protein [Serratia marcescens]